MDIPILSLFLSFKNYLIKLGQVLVVALWLQSVQAQ